MRRLILHAFREQLAPHALLNVKETLVTAGEFLEIWSLRTGDHVALRYLGDPVQSLCALESGQVAFLQTNRLSLVEQRGSHIVLLSECSLPGCQEIFAFHTGLLVQTGVSSDVWYWQPGRRPTRVASGARILYSGKTGFALANKAPSHLLCGFAADVFS